MTRFYVQNVIAKLTPGLIPEDWDDIDDYIVDGANDGGADFIFRSDNAVLIIQSKFRGRDKNEDPSELSYFCDVLQRLHGAARGKKRFNRKVMEAISDIDWEADYFDLRFCTVGKTSGEMLTRADEGPNLIVDLKDLRDRADVSLLNETELNKSLREAISADKEPDTAVSLRFAPNGKGEPCILLTSKLGRDMYVGQVSGAELAQMYAHNKYRLFAMNIRDYVGDTATNRGIVETARSRPDDFLFFNNGISAVATQINEDSEDPTIVHCEHFSIINGAQTVRSLYKAHTKFPGSVNDVRVMMRVLQFRPGKDGEFLSDVTRFNNTQNSIKISDFRSNDPVQKDLRAKFARISVGARTCDYKNKRRREADGNKFAIGMEEFAKTVHTFMHGPDDMSGGTRFLFDASSKGGYQRVFGEPVSHMTDEHFELGAGIYFLCHEVETVWKIRRAADSDEGTTSPALERRWLVYYSVGELLRMIYAKTGGDLNADLRYLSNPNKWMNLPKGHTKSAIEELFDLASTAMKQAYGKVCKASDFRHRNWFRNSQTLVDIREELSVIPKYRKADLPVLRAHMKAATQSS